MVYITADVSFSQMPFIKSGNKYKTKTTVAILSNMQIISNYLLFEYQSFKGAEILLKVALNVINPKPKPSIQIDNI